MVDKKLFKSGNLSGGHDPARSDGDKKGNSSHDAEREVEIGAAIGNKLRKLYGDIANEPVPDRFAELLKQLDQDKHGSDGD